MRDIPAITDIVVIGGGPAGSTAANLLARDGYDVVLFEKVRHPRNTVGESVLPHVWKYLDMAGAVSLDNQEQTPVDGTSVSPSKTYFAHLVANF